MAIWKETHAMIIKELEEILKTNLQGFTTVRIRTDDDHEFCVEFEDGFISAAWCETEEEAA